MSEILAVGDKIQFEKLVKEHMDYAFGTAYALLGHREDAWDAVQESLIKCYHRRHTYRGDGTFAAWWHRIVVNECRALRRKRWLGRLLPFSRRPGEKERNIFEEQCRERERQERLTMALSRLPMRQKEVVSLRYFQGLSLEEISQRTGRKLGTIKAQLNQARLRLSELMEEKDGEIGS